MKRIFQLIIFCFATTIATAQSKEGTIEYELTTRMIDSTYKVKYDADMFPGSYLHISFMTNKTRLTLNLEKGFCITLIADYESNQGLRLFKSEKALLAMPCKANEAKLTQDNKRNDQVILVDETKTILGYTCKKAILKSDTTEIEYWYTNEINYDFSGMNIITTKVPGFPMKFSTYSKGMLMTFEAKKVSTRIDNPRALFTLEVPEGYVLTDEETIKKGASKKPTE